MYATDTYYGAVVGAPTDGFVALGSGKPMVGLYGLAGDDLDVLGLINRD